MKRTRNLVAASMLVLGCSSPQPASSHASGDAVAHECVALDFSAEAQLSVIDEGGVRIHTFRAPDMSSGTATHIIETEDSLVLVDTQLFLHYAQAFRRYADSLAKPISHVIVSHGHPDHYLGLQVFADLPSYALAATIEDIRQRGNFHLRAHQEGGECEAVGDHVPTLGQTLEPGLRVIGGVELEFEWVARAEDDDQLVIKVPAARTLILQDLMATDTHAFVSAGMTRPWIETLQGYADDEAYTHVLAGHGSPTDRAGIETMIDYLRRSEQILATATSAPEFIEQFETSFPDKRGLYLVELMAKLRFAGK